MARASSIAACACCREPDCAPDMILMGLTGGVGMGKTTAARALQARSIPVIDTDELARDLVEPGQPAWREVRQAFGADILGSDGQLLRSKLAGIVFSEPSARQTLERILHPRIRETWRAEAGRWRQQGCRVGCVVIPLLYETGAEAELDRVVCAACSAVSQQQRLLARGWSASEIEHRLAAQLPVAQKLLKADYVLWTEGDPSLIPEQWESILAHLGDETVRSPV